MSTGSRIARWLAVVVSAATLTGCAVSRLDPGAAVSVHGSVLDGASQPAAGAKVALFKEADLGETLVGVTFAVASFGAACFTDQKPSICGRARTATTTADGVFSFRLRGRDTQGLVANAGTFHLVASLSSGQTVLRFRIQRTDLALPPVRVWSARASAEAITGGTAPGGVRVSWPALPDDGYGTSPSYTVRFLQDQPEALVWSVADARSPVQIDGRVLEDRRGDVVVEASTTVDGPGTKVETIYQSGPAPYAATGAPPSRHSPCSVSGATGEVQMLDRCPFTDGNLSAASLRSTSAERGVSVRSVVSVDLGAPRPVSLVVVRGAAGTVAVDSSDDGATWTSLGSGRGDFTLEARGAHGRHVRLRTPDGLDLSGLVEISVW